MKKLLFFAPILFISATSLAQNFSIQQNDSLKGFDEKTLITEAVNNGVDKEELSTYLALSRRNFIKSKYNLKTPIIDYASIAKTSAAACINEDFEEGSLTSAVPGTIAITASNTINGWTAGGGSNSGGSTINCTFSNALGAPTAIQLIAPGPSGLIDGIIGAGYPIHSVFGNSLNTMATTLNGFNCYGDWFAKINNQIPGSSVNRLTKTINVTPSNVYFNFAVMAVFEGGHCCCDGGAVSIIFKDCLGNLLATAQQYSIAAPAAAGCVPSGTCATSNSLTVFTSTLNANWKYSKWSNSSIDLSLWMGQCIITEFTTFDCAYAGHAGYAYIDAQCAPVVVNGLNTPSNYVYYKVYPNPTAGNFNIQVSKEIDNGEIELRNVLGQVVLRQPVKQGTNQIKNENLAKGIYNYSVLSNKEVISIGKVVLE